MTHHYLFTMTQKGFPQDCLHNGNFPMTELHNMEIPMTELHNGIPHTVLSMTVISCTKYRQAALCHMPNIDY